jgi:hypothetical protein
MNSNKLDNKNFFTSRVGEGGHLSRNHSELKLIKSGNIIAISPVSGKKK